MNADKLINPYNPNEVLMETRPDGCQVWRLGPFRSVWSPTTETLYNEMYYGGFWYVVDTTPLSDELEHIADGTYPKSIFN